VLLSDEEAMQIIAVLADVLDGHDVHDAVSAAWSLLSNRLAAQAGVADPSPEYLAGLRRRLAARTSAASNSSRFTISDRSLAGWPQPQESRPDPEGAVEPSADWPRWCTDADSLTKSVIEQGIGEGASERAKWTREPADQQLPACLHQPATCRVARTCVRSACTGEVRPAPGDRRVVAGREGGLRLPAGPALSPKRSSSPKLTGTCENGSRGRAADGRYPTRGIVAPRLRFPSGRWVSAREAVVPATSL
jgi:hypothetical protein